MTVKTRANRAVIIANGPLPYPVEVRQHIGADDRLICANGGTYHARAMSLTPDIVVGDLDSLEPTLRAELEAAGVRFEVYPADKDKTDLELALDLAIAEGATEVDILAIQGGRLDQSLANLMLLTRPEWAAVQVRGIAGDEIAWAVRDGQVVNISGRAGDRVSLIPLTTAVTGVTLEGVKWPLQNATLHLGSTWSISNVLASSTARLHVGEGVVLVIQATNSDQEEDI